MAEFYEMGQEEFNIKNKKVLVRIDLNSPVDPNRQIHLNMRFIGHKKTLVELDESSTVLMAHQGRPGMQNFLPLEQHATILSKMIGKEVVYVDDNFGSRAIESIKHMDKGDIILLENTRHYAGEMLDRSQKEHSRDHMIMKLSKLFDLYINDAFAVSHRSHLTVTGFALSLKSGSGLLFSNEIAQLNRVLIENNHPCVIFLAGANVEDSLNLIKNVLDNRIADKILTAGQVGLIFLIASGVDVSNTNKEFLANPECLAQLGKARMLLQTYPEKILFPLDLALDFNGDRIECPVSQMKNYRAFDLGSTTIDIYSTILKESEISIINGVPGRFNWLRFSKGTQILLEAATKANFSLACAGSGYTIEAIDHYGLAPNFTHVSTGGTSSLIYLSGGVLPGLDALKESYIKFNL